MYALIKCERVEMLSLGRSNVKFRTGNLEAIPDCCDVKRRTSRVSHNYFIVLVFANDFY